ncbi:glycosyltransferase [Rhodobacteraceae bacterium RKSG542]|uniref:glycosyltransferase family 4 protein n=1 Tax=Pseudovibrio flavus TaxID=2529854 RepID=UPI0012BD578B|nr:glycosyltransferase family 4 protein [Pseudovibrio flavus]MTI17026.1 glycosyltransferase [Pseudovibrio flavus]
MQIAFLSPMKPLTSPVPSGDRTMGRLIVRALSEGGHTVEIASTFRSWSAEGGDEHFKALENSARLEAHRLIQNWKARRYRPDVMLTYHLYHKAPDWIGPIIAEYYGCPYIIVEASRAPKHKDGEWALGFAAADAALAKADRVVAVHKADAQCLEDVVPARKLSIISPFVDAQKYSPDAGDGDSQPKSDALRLLCVAMMRPGDKMRSYTLLAEALQTMKDLNWHLTIIGDGDNAGTVHRLFEGLPVSFKGTVRSAEMPKVYCSHDIMVWPAIREAFGFALLEAQSCGVPVVAGDSLGVPDIIAHKETGLLSKEGSVEPFAKNLRKLCENTEQREQMGKAAREKVLSVHSLEHAKVQLNDLLESALAERMQRGESGGSAL